MRLQRTVAVHQVKISDSAVSAEQIAYDYLKSSILEMRFRPDQVVTESDLSEELNLSRTPIQSALRRLEYEGLVVNQPRRGWKVSSLTLDDIHEIFTIKEALETLIVAQATACEDEDLRASLRIHMDEMEHQCALGNLEQWDIAHLKWHAVIVKMSDYPEGRIVQIVSTLNAQWRRVRKSLLAIDGRMQRETREHGALCEVILAGNVEEARQMQLDHLKHVRADLVNLLTHLVLPYTTGGV